MASTTIKPPAVGGKEAEEEASIYICMRVVHGQSWYVIKKDTPNAEILTPVFLTKKKRHGLSAPTAVGSTLYDLGGEIDPCLCCKGCYKTQGLDTVEFVEPIECPDEDDDDDDDWEKGEQQLKVARVQAYAVTVNDQIYVFGGRTRPSRTFFDSEVYDPRGQSSRLLNRLPFPIAYITSHAVINGGKQVLLLNKPPSPSPARIYCYDVEADSYKPYERRNKKRLFGKYTVDAITSLDGVLYAFGYHIPGSIMYLDPSRPNAVAKRVKGLEKLSWMPGPTSDGFLPGIHFVPIGANKLALVWGFRLIDLYPVYCARITMVKKRNADNEVTVFAKDPVLSLFAIRGFIFSMTKCLPIFPNPNAKRKNRGNNKKKMETKKSFLMALKEGLPGSVPEPMKGPSEVELEKKNGNKSHTIAALGGDMAGSFFEHMEILLRDEMEKKKGNKNESESESENDSGSVCETEWELGDCKNEDDYDTIWRAS